MSDDQVSWNAGECPACAVPGTRWEFLATAEQPEGQYAALEITAQAGKGPPLHRHRARAGFYVLEGEYEFVVEGRRVVCRAGGFATIPSSAAHRWRNVGESQGRLLCFVTPGGLEGYFGRIGAPLAGRTAPPPARPGVGGQDAKGLAAEFGI